MFELSVLTCASDTDSYTQQLESSLSVAEQNTDVIVRRTKGNFGDWHKYVNVNVMINN